MKFAILLEELIRIADKSKTDFALSMNMTPSGLSKILAGKRVPPLKERKSFAKETAAYFAEALFSPKCYLKLEEIFPIIYDFESVIELQHFLDNALEYAFDEFYAKENRLMLEYSDRGMYYIGKKPVLNQICILLSDYVLKNQGDTMEWLASLPLFNPIYLDIFQRLIVNDKYIKQSSMDYYVNESFLNDDSKPFAYSFIAMIAGFQKSVNLSFWSSHNFVEENFLFLRGQMLLLFRIEVDGTPILTPVFHKTYLAIFYNSLMKNAAKKLTYCKEDVSRIIREKPDALADLMATRIDCIYNFAPIGYLINQEEIAALSGAEDICEVIYGIIQNILGEESLKFVISTRAMESFLAAGQAIVPLLGYVNIPIEQRGAHLDRYSRHVVEKHFAHLHIVESRLNDIVVICAGNYNLICSFNPDTHEERYHLFHTDKIYHAVEASVIEKIGDFTQEIWEGYISNLANFYNIL